MKALKLFAAGLLLAGLTYTAHSQAQVEVFTIDMNNKQFQGQNRVINLKQELNRAYPDWDFSNARLNRVNIYAKSRNGNGQVELQIAGNPQDRKGIDGRPADFQSNRANTYFNIRLDSANNTRGTWRLVLDGNNKVSKIELRVRDAVEEDGNNEEPSTRYVNVGTGNTIKFIPTAQTFNVNETGVETLRIEGRTNIQAFTQVVVEYANGSRQTFNDADFEGAVFAGQRLELDIRDGHVRRVTITGLTANPFGENGSYRVSVRVTN